MEAVPDRLHHAVRGVRPEHRALPVDLAGAGGRAVRLRDGLPHRPPADRRARVRRDRRGLRLRRPAVEQQVRARRGARQLRADARGDRVVGVRAPPRRAPRPRPLPRRGRRVHAAGGLAVPRALRALAVVRGAAPAQAHDRLRRAHPGGLVPARVVGVGRAVPRGRARERSQPRERGLRRHPGAGGAAPLRLAHDRSRRGGHDRRGGLRGYWWRRNRGEGETLALAIGGAPGLWWWRR